MKCVITRERLLTLTTKAAAIAEQRSSQPLLGRVVLSAAATAGWGPVLVAQASDLQTGLRTHEPCEVTEGGEVAVDAKRLRELVARLPDGDVTLSTDAAEHLVVRANRSRYRLPTMSTEELAATPSLPKDWATVSARAVLDVLEAVSPAMADDTTRPHLSCVLLEIERLTMRGVATDGHRLHKREVSVQSDVELSLMLPPKAVAEVGRIAKSAESTIEIGKSGPYVFVRSGTTTFHAKLVDEVFPPYQKVIPRDCRLAFHVSTEGLAASLKRLSKISNGIALSVEPGSLTLSAKSPDVGEGTEQIDCDATISAEAIGVNPHYLLDALDGAPDTVRVGLIGALDPVVVAAVGYLAVIMPMRL